MPSRKDARRERRGGAARPDVEHPALVVVVQAGVLSGSPSDLGETDAYWYQVNITLVNRVASAETDRLARHLCGKRSFGARTHEARTTHAERRDRPFRLATALPTRLVGDARARTARLTPGVTAGSVSAVRPSRSLVGDSFSLCTAKGADDARAMDTLVRPPTLPSPPIA